MTIEIELDYSQQRWLNILPRIGACISFFCSLYLIFAVVSSPYYRNRIYHRIMMSCALNTIILNINQLWGSSAVPKEKDLLGARGNEATCSAQGFLMQLSFVIPSYYVALSLLSYCSLRHKFRVCKYKYIEKWIHMGVYVFPIVSATYLLKIEAYNYIVIGCWVASEPVGCGDQSDFEIECTRGPQNIGQLQILFLAIPSVLVLLIPTMVMALLYLQVRNLPGGKRVAASLAKQSGLYLCAQYWTYLFRFLDALLVFAFGEFVFATNLLANFIEALQGLWTLCVYLYFRVEDPTTRDHNEMSITIKRETETNSNNKSREFSIDGSIAKPRFSIFDGTNISNLDSPWAAFLLDEGEDEEYDENAEYTDENDFNMFASRMFVVEPPTIPKKEATTPTATTTKTSTPPPEVRDSDTTMETAPFSSTRSSDV